MIVKSCGRDKQSAVRWAFLLTLIVVSAKCVAQTQPFFADGHAPTPDGKSWQLVELLSDEFEGSQLDPTKWTADPKFKGFGWIGRPPGLFQPESVTIKDGKLQVTVGVLDSPKTIKGNQYKYHGAIIRSVHPIRPGWYCECRMKANATEMSSTFWLMTPAGAPKRLELDIQECIGRTTELTEGWARNWDQVFHSNLIQWSVGDHREKVQNQASVETETKNSQRFSVYGAWWKSPREIRFYLDGKYVYSLIPGVDWDIPAHYQMAIETYDWNPVPADGGMVASGTAEQRTTHYDWVRTWKLK